MAVRDAFEAAVRQLDSHANKVRTQQRARSADGSSSPRLSRRRAGSGRGLVRLTSPGVPDLDSAGPKAFGGPGDQWSPETLLLAAVSDCFILTFRAIAAANKLEWESLECNATGTLDKVEREIRVSQIELDVKLVVGDESVVEQAGASWKIGEALLDQQLAALRYEGARRDPGHGRRGSLTRLDRAEMALLRNGRGRCFCRATVFGLPRFCAGESFAVLPGGTECASASAPVGRPLGAEIDGVVDTGGAREALLIRVSSQFLRLAEASTGRWSLYGFVSSVKSSDFPRGFVVSRAIIGDPHLVREAPLERKVACVEVGLGEGGAPGQPRRYSPTNSANPAASIGVRPSAAGSGAWRVS
ncbi:MAG: OsmC family protein [Polyangiaceae bacterium]